MAIILIDISGDYISIIRAQTFSAISFPLWLIIYFVGKFLERQAGLSCSWGLWVGIADVDVAAVAVAAAAAAVERQIVSAF